MLANCYFLGVGTSRNVADAIRWYVAAARSGSVDAMLSLGHIYAQGRDVARDLAEAVRWFDQAAEKQRQETDFEREHRYFEQDLALGFYISLQCAAVCREAVAGSSAAFEIIEEYYIQSDRGAQDSGRPMAFVLDQFFSSYYVSMDNEAFHRKLEEWAESSIPAALIVLGESLLHGGADKSSTGMGTQYLRLAAEQGDIYAMHLLGDVGHYPEEAGGVRPGENPASAEWYYRAAALGDPEAKFKLAYLGEGAIYTRRPAETPPYQQDECLEDNHEYQRVVGLYRELAELGHPRAQARLAAMLDGSSPAFFRRRTRLKECRAAQNEAEHWLRKAAENGYAKAAYRLAERLDTGREEYLPHSPEVIHWYRTASRGGEKYACGKLLYAHLMGRGVPQDGAEAMYWRRT
jgi:TPR repeat protein